MTPPVVRGGRPLPLPVAAGAPGLSEVSDRALGLASAAAGTLNDLFLGRDGVIGGPEVSEAQSLSLEYLRCASERMASEVIPDLSDRDAFVKLGGDVITTSSLLRSLRWT